MKQNRRVVAVNFDRNEPEAIPTIVSLSEQAQAMQLQCRAGMVADGYNIRKVDCSKIHGVAGGDLDKLADAMELADGARVLDLMCGYGAVSAHVIDYAARAGISVRLEHDHFPEAPRVKARVRGGAPIDLVRQRGFESERVERAARCCRIQIS